MMIHSSHLGRIREMGGAPKCWNRDISLSPYLSPYLSTYLSLHLPISLQRIREKGGAPLHSSS